MEPQRIPGTARIINVRQSDLTARARAAGDVARMNAAAVDAEARFPGEAFVEIRKQRLLGLQVPQASGGEGASIAEIADVCYILGQACSSTALIYAMHQIKMACIVRHAKGSAALELNWSSFNRRVPGEQNISRLLRRRLRPWDQDRRPVFSGFNADDGFLLLPNQNLITLDLNSLDL